MKEDSNCLERDGFNDSLGINTQNNVGDFQLHKVGYEISHRHQAKYHLGLFITVLVKYCTSFKVMQDQGLKLPSPAV